MKAGRRTTLLLLLGVLYNWGWAIDLETMRFPSVLGLIGVTYFVAAIALSATVNRGVLLCVTIAILTITTLAHLVVSVPGGAPGVLTPEGSINSWLDQTLLPGRLHGETYDPEGLLGVFSSSSITLAGVLAGLTMVSIPRRNAAMMRCAVYFLAAGFALLLIGFALAPAYPPIKKIWTAPFDIIAIGSSLILLAMAILLFDIWNRKKLGIGLAAIGANAILAYFGARYLIYPVYGPAENWPPAMSAAVVAVLMIGMWFVLAALYRRRIFWRL